MNYLRVGKCLVHIDEIRHVEPRIDSGNLTVQIGYPTALQPPLTGDDAMAFAADFKKATGRCLIEMAGSAAIEKPDPRAADLYAFERFLERGTQDGQTVKGKVVQHYVAAYAITDDEYENIVHRVALKVVYIDGNPHMARAGWNGPRSTVKPVAEAASYVVPDDDDTHHDMMRDFTLPMSHAEDTKDYIPAGKAKVAS